VIVGATGALIVDAGASPAHVHALHAELERHSLPAPRFVASPELSRAGEPCLKTKDQRRMPNTVASSVVRRRAYLRNLRIRHPRAKPALTAPARLWYSACG
jgi:hypothetical protein